MGPLRRRGRVEVNARSSGIARKTEGIKTVIDRRGFLRIYTPTTRRTWTGPIEMVAPPNVALPFSVHL